MDILLCDPAKKAPIPTMSTRGGVEADNTSGLARIVRTRSTVRLRKMPAASFDDFKKL